MKTRWAIMLLLLVSVGLHGRLASPREVIFDEVHFGKFVTAYCCTHERFFDIHPPQAKLFIAGTARLFGYRGGFDFDHIGEPYGTISPLPLRLFAALTGVILPLIFWGLLRQVGVSEDFSFLGGLAVALDNAIVVQTRMIALDGFLLVTTLGSLLVYLCPTTLKLRGARAWGMYVLSGMLAGLAAGTKFTGLAALALLGVLVIFNFQFSIFKRFLRGLVILLAAFLVYIAGWWLHFALLTQPGPGDVWGLPTGNFWQDTVKLHKTMLSANYHLTATHPDESPWWSWPFMLTSVFYWSGAGGAVIYFLGNPVVWWGSTVLFVLAFLFSKRETWQRNWVFLVGFLIAILPLTRVPRALFLYHYLTPLVFALAFGLVWLDGQIQNQKSKIQIAIVGAIVLGGGFVLFSPLTYGFQVFPGWLTAIFWLPGWR